MMESIHTGRITVGYLVSGIVPSYDGEYSYWLDHCGVLGLRYSTSYDGEYSYW